MAIKEVAAGSAVAQKLHETDRVLGDYQQQIDSIDRRVSQLETHEGPTAAVTGTAIVEDQKTSGTAGGTFTLGADRTRDLNTIVSDLSGIVGLAANQFTLAAGTYLIEWSAPAFRVDEHQSILYDVTAASNVARGSNSYTTSGSNTAVTESRGNSIVTIAVSSAFEIRHRSTATQATNGFGRPASFGTEVYTRVKITKLA